MKLFRTAALFFILFLTVVRFASASVGSELNRFQKEDDQKFADKTLQSKDEPVDIQVDGSDASQTSRLEQDK